MGSAAWLAAGGEFMELGWPSELVPRETIQLILLHLFLLMGTHHPGNAIPVIV